MTENPQFTQFLDDMIALAQTDEAGEYAAIETVEQVDADNRWNGELIEAWRARWRPIAEDRMAMQMFAIQARLAEAGVVASTPKRKRKAR